MIITNESGHITQFLEKPSWGEVFSDTINTGIYVLDPQIFSYFEKNKQFDFSQELFPMMLRKRGPDLWLCCFKGLLVRCWQSH